MVQSPSFEKKLLVIARFSCQSFIFVVWKCLCIKCHRFIIQEQYEHPWWICCSVWLHALKHSKHKINQNNKIVDCPCRTINKLLIFWLNRCWRSFSFGLLFCVALLQEYTVSFKIYSMIFLLFLHASMCCACQSKQRYRIFKSIIKWPNDCCILEFKIFFISFCFFV